MYSCLAVQIASSNCAGFADKKDCCDCALRKRAAKRRRHCDAIATAAAQVGGEGEGAALTAGHAGPPPPAVATAVGQLQPPNVVAAATAQRASPGQTGPLPASSHPRLPPPPPSAETAGAAWQVHLGLLTRALRRAAPRRRHRHRLIGATTQLGKGKFCADKVQIVAHHTVDRRVRTLLM